MNQLEVICPGCHHPILLPPEAVGRRARCPQCGAVWEIPAAELAQAAEPSDSLLWWLETPESRRYGPVDQNLLDSWVSEGRVTADCRISRDGAQSWQDAGEYYPVLQMVLHAAVGAHHPFSQAAVTAPPDVTGSVVSPRYLAPHRGGLILTLGIMSWIACPVVAFFAWTMGSGDLQEMKEGRMDPSGEGLTRAGYWLGIVQVAILLILLVTGIFILIIGYAAGAWAATSA